MKSVVDFFKNKKSSWVEENSNPDMPPIYYPKNDLRPPVFEEGEYETKDNQLFRFERLPPTTVLHELATAIKGELTRLNPSNERSTPVVLKNTKYGSVTIVWYKRSLQFTIYKTSDTAYKKMITNRETIFGIQQALKMIENDEYSGVLSED